MAVPTDISGLTLWLKADAGTFTDTGRTTPASANNDPVGGWADQSGSGNHVSQGTGGSRPLLKTANLNGIAGVLFDGSDDFLTAAGSLLGGASSYTKIVVWKPAVLNVGNCLISTLSTHALYYAGTAFPRAYHGGATVVSTTASVVGTPEIVSALSDGSANVTQARIFQQGVLTAEDVLAAASDSTGQIGGFNGTNLLSGHLYEAILFNRKITRAEHKSMVDYLCTRWGLTPPTYGTKIKVLFEGDSLTFGTGSSGTTGTAIPGGTSYPARVMTTLGTTSYTGANFGVSGSMYNLTGTSMNSFARLVAADGHLDLGTSKGVALVWCGTNDIALNNDSAATVEAACQAYCLDRRSHGYLVIVLNMLPRGGTFNAPTDAGNFATRQAAFNVWLAANYTSFADDMVDVATLLPDYNNAAKYTDTVHLTDSGYQDVANAVAPKVAALAPAASSSAGGRRGRGRFGMFRRLF